MQREGIAGSDGLFLFFLIFTLAWMKSEALIPQPTKHVLLFFSFPFIYLTHSAFFRLENLAWFAHVPYPSWFE